MQPTNSDINQSNTSAYLATSRNWSSRRLSQQTNEENRLAGSTLSLSLQEELAPLVATKETSWNEKMRGVDVCGKAQDATHKFI